MNILQLLLVIGITLAIFAIATTVCISYIMVSVILQQSRNCTILPDIDRVVDEVIVAMKKSAVLPFASAPFAGIHWCLTDGKYHIESAWYLMRNREIRQRYQRRKAYRESQEVRS